MRSTRKMDTAKKLANKYKSRKSKKESMSKKKELNYERPPDKPFINSGSGSKKGRT